MTVHDTQRDRLRRTIHRAREIEAHLADVRARYLGRVHFRPSSTSIAMIGLLPDRPQRGNSSITNLPRLADTFEHTFTTHCVACDHGRATTPENRLQSHLVAAAYRDSRIPRLLARHARDPREGELAALGIRVVGYCETANGFDLHLGRSRDS